MKLDHVFFVVVVVFCRFFSPDLTCQVFVWSPGSFQTTHTSNVTALCVKSGGIAPFKRLVYPQIEHNRTHDPFI